MNWKYSLNSAEQKKLQRFLLRWSGKSDIQTTILRQGKIEGVAFLVAILKQKTGQEIIGYFFKKSHLKLKTRYQNLKLLEKRGFAKGKFTAPLPLYYSKHILLRSGALGKNFWSQARKNPKILEKQIKNIALWLKKLHSLKIRKPFFNVFKDDKKKIDSYINSIVKAKLAKKNELAKIKILLIKAQKKTKPAFIHNDLHPENIFFDKNKIMVIDFDSSGLGDPLMDIGYFIAQLRYRTLIQKKLISQKQLNQLIEKFLFTYFDKKNIQPEILAKINLYQARSDLRLAGFITEFVIPQTKGKERKKFTQEAKYLIKLINKIKNSA